MKLFKDIDVKGKLVFLRVDFNVPLDESGAVRDDTRIRASLPTIKALLGGGARLVLASHLGRPKGKFNPKMSLKPAADRLSELIVNKVIMAPDVIGDEVDQLKSNLEQGDVLMLENLRFYKEEEANDPDFSRRLADRIDLFVNDAFGSSHRAHASVVGITGFVPVKAAGFLMEKEVKALEKIVKSPARPYLAILGGAKVSDKIGIIESLLGKADRILIGGAMTYTFLHAQGYGTGKSLVEADQKQTALDIIEKAKAGKVDLVFPCDHVIASAAEAGADTSITAGLPFPENMMGVDIGPATIEKYSSAVEEAATIFWNGPMGIFEIEPFAKGTMEVALALARSKGFSVVGGGDSIAAIEKAGVREKIGHISTGGGASLEYVASGTLPGIEELEK